METVLSFHGFFAQHIKRADAPFGISVGDAFLGNGPKAFVIQTFGFGNTEGALSLVIHADCFRITRQTWSDDLRCFYHNPADCNGVYIDNEDLLDLLDQFSTPNKLVKELATIFILSERKLYKIN
jgi:hypothetical protein